jgi:nucleotide-binding universal stress UspA family protein
METYLGLNNRNPNRSPINMFKKIWVPIDGSKHSHDALKTALELAKIHDSNLEILHVTSFSEEYTPTGPESDADTESEETASPPEWISEYMAKLRENDEEMLSQALKDAETLYPDLKITAKLLWGRPGKTIVSEAEEGRFDLIVVGSRGLGGLAELVLGSVSHHVVNESKIPVLVVK